MDNVPDHVYRAIDAVNWSTLKYLRESPLHYRHALTAQRKDTTAMAVGRAIHALVFEPAVFERDFAIYEDGDRRGKAWEAFKEQHQGQTILKANEVENAAAAANAVRTHPLVSPYLTGGEFEKVITWTDPETGLACKARLDWNTPTALIDLKSTTTIDAFRFGRIAARLGYHCQLGGHYRNGVIHGLGYEPKETLIVAVEAEAPFDVGVFVLDPDTIAAGAGEVGALLRRLKEGRESGAWPGRYTEPAPLMLPSYVYGDDEDADGLGLTFNGDGA